MGYLPGACSCTQCLDNFWRFSKVSGAAPPLRGFRRRRISHRSSRAQARRSCLTRTFIGPVATYTSSWQTHFTTPKTDPDVVTPRKRSQCALAVPCRSRAGPFILALTFCHRPETSHSAPLITGPQRSLQDGSGALQTILPLLTSVAPTLRYPQPFTSYYHTLCSPLPEALFCHILLDRIHCHHHRASPHRHHHTRRRRRFKYHKAVADRLLSSDQSLYRLLYLSVFLYY